MSMLLELYFIIGWVFGLLYLIYGIRNDENHDEVTCMIVTSLLYWPVNLCVIIYYLVKGIIKYRQCKNNK